MIETTTRGGSTDARLPNLRSLPNGDVMKPVHDHDDPDCPRARRRAERHARREAEKSQENAIQQSGFGGIFRRLFSKMPWQESATAEDEKTIPAPRSGAISIHNANGKTRVIGEDREDILIRIQKKVSADCPDRAQRLLDSIQISDERAGDVLEIEVQIPRRCSRRAVAHIEVRVPRATRVASRSANGRICIEGLERSIRARSSNGAIDIREIIGDIDVTTANAKVACRATQGRLLARSSNGKIEVGGHTGSIDASTSNGVIKATIDALGEGGILLSTSNGRIVLELPEDSNADVDMKVDNGHIRNDLALESTLSSPAEGRVQGRIGKGGTPIRLRTSNGTISLR